MKAQTTIKQAGKLPHIAVTIFHESLAAREHALTLFEQFSAPAPAMDSPACHAFEELADAHRQHKASRSAMKADILAFAIEAGGDFSAPFKRWTEEWLVCRGRRGGLLLGLVKPGKASTTGVVGMKEIFLRHLAHRAGMDYLSNFPATAVRFLPDTLDAFAQRADRVSPLLAEILHTHPVVVPPWR